MSRPRRSEIDERLHATARARLEQADQRYTSARRRLVQALAVAGGPLSVADLLSGAVGLPQSSVYRNLADLVQAGVVSRVNGTDDFVRYELAEDLAGHHHHLVCTGCGAIADVTLPRAIEQAVGRAADEVATATGFRPIAHRVDLLGTCSRCS